ncbi:MAG TPA: hypothetical protein VGQ36_23250 [Thermoanaerobaculia bacterium]|jgi:preprotein translocase subunit SecD|nr:hypothetical protein [Thermoanaerobaculia bacterium]
MKKTLGALLVVLLVLGCDGFVGEVRIDKPRGAPVAIADADYLILRPVSTAPGPGLTAATVHGQTVYYNPTTRIMDLRHLDPRTAKVDEGRAGTHVVPIETTPEGDRLLGTWTSANLEKQLGVFLDGRLISAPHIRTKITGMIVVEDELTKDRAEAILARLQRGGAAD